MAILTKDMRPEVMMRQVCHIVAQTDAMFYDKEEDVYRFGYSGWRGFMHQTNNNIGLLNDKLNAHELSIVESAVNILVWTR